MVNANRYKNLIVSKGDVFHLLIHPMTESAVIHKYELPDDVEVISVCYDYARQAFIFTLKSDTFELIEEGICLPDIYAESSQLIKLVNVEYRK